MLVVPVVMIVVPWAGTLATTLCAAWRWGGERVRVRVVRAAAARSFSLYMGVTTGTAVTVAVAVTVVMAGIASVVELESRVQELVEEFGHGGRSEVESGKVGGKGGVL